MIKVSYLISLYRQIHQRKGKSPIWFQGLRECSGLAPLPISSSSSSLRRSASVSSMPCLPISTRWRIYD